MKSYVVNFADCNGNHEVSFLWKKAQAQSYFNKLKHKPKIHVDWAELLCVHNEEDFDCIDYFYTDDRYAHLFKDYEKEEG